MWFWTPNEKAHGMDKATQGPSLQPRGWGGRQDTLRRRWRRRRMQLGRSILCQTRRTILQLSCFNIILLLLWFWTYIEAGLGIKQFLCKKDRAGILWQKKTIFKVFLPLSVSCPKFKMPKQCLHEPPPSPFLSFPSPLSSSSSPLWGRATLTWMFGLYLTLFGPPLVKVKL